MDYKFPPYFIVLHTICSVTVYFCCHKAGLDSYFHKSVMGKTIEKGRLGVTLQLCLAGQLVVSVVTKVCVCV